MTLLCGYGFLAQGNDLDVLLFYFLKKFVYVYNGFLTSILLSFLTPSPHTPDPHADPFFFLTPLSFSGLFWGDSLALIRGTYFMCLLEHKQIYCVIYWSMGKLTSSYTIEENY